MTEKPDKGDQMEEGFDLDEEDEDILDSLFEQSKDEIIDADAKTRRKIDVFKPGGSE